RTDLTVCGEAASAAEAISAIGQLRPDVVLLDLDLGDSHGREVLRAVTEMNERPSVVVLSMADEAVHALQSLRGGAVGYVMKDTPPEQIIE
ncbi:response regulator transcription factor, partial [Pseudomonas sp. MPR-R2A4]|uniref:response regulator n=1 Tax=Pseudomonas sp. MPR-R2A4 TaxID=2070620 RepID=UPI000CCB93A5